MDDVDAATARWLVSDEGAALLDETRASIHRGDDVLAVGTRLRARGIPPARAAALTAVASIEGQLLGDPVAVQQASHPVVASWRARRFRGSALVVDLCAGIGGDAIAISGAAARVVGIERDPARATFLAANAATAGAAVDTVVGDALRPPVGLSGHVHVDPGRRHQGRRARRLADYRPAVSALDAVTAGARGRGIVVSPAVDLDDPDLPDGELEFIEVDGALVEATVWTGDTRAGDATATVLPEGVTRTRHGAPEHLHVGGVGEWLVEPSAAAVRARLHDDVGREVGAWRIARRRALLTSDVEPPSSPWLRARRVAAVLAARDRSVRDWLRTADERPVEVATYGLDVDPEAFWRAIGRPARGPAGWRIDLVRLDDGAAAIVSATA